MEAVVDVEAGICGFRTSATARCDDAQYVAFDLETDCDKIRNLGATLKAADPIDAYGEIMAGTPSRLLSTCGEQLPGCCAVCAVPVGLFKAMQVAAGLALPRDIAIRLRKA